MPIDTHTPNIASVGTPYFVLEEGLWSPRDKQYFYRYWQVYSKRQDAIKDSQFLQAYRIVECKVITIGRKYPSAA